MKTPNTVNRTGIVTRSIKMALNSALLLAPLALSTLSLAKVPGADAASTEVSSAPNPAPSTQPVQVEQIVGAQINITRDSISHLMRTLQDRGDDQSLAAPDYQAAQVAFAATADRVTRAYEQKLNQQVLRPMADLLVRYNAVLAAQSFSDTQRSLILTNLKTQLNALARSLAPKYKTLLKEVYAVSGNLPFEYKIRLSDTDNNSGRYSKDYGWMRTRFYGIINGNSVRANRLEYTHARHGSVENHSFEPLESLIYIRGSSEQTAFPIDYFSYESSGQAVNRRGPDGGRTHYGDPSYSTILFRQAQWLTNVIIENPRAFDSVFEQLVYPAIAQGCQSELCLMLRAADLTTYVSLTYESLDRNLTFTAQDGFEVTVQSPKLDHEHVLNLLMWQSNPDRLPYTVQ